MTTGAEAAVARWLLLIHQIPPKPDYLRVKVGRRLQRVGAMPIKNSVYVLPEREGSLEDFQWIRTEIAAGGGDAFVCRAEFIDGLTSEQIRHLFRSARNADYAEIAGRARALRSEFRSESRPPRGGAGGGATTARKGEELARLRRHLAAVDAIDFFAAPERVMAKEALDALEAELSPRGRAGDAEPASRASHPDYRGRIWVTREGVFVDRMASAWLIRRYVDSDAQFKFVRPGAYRPAHGELRFDMFDGEFTHVGDRCTFEVLLDRFALDDPALRSLAEVVHDIDLKDGKFGRVDAPGIERVLAGIACAHPDDEARVERAAALFDELWASFAAEEGGLPPSAGDASRRE